MKEFTGQEVLSLNSWFNLFPWKHKIRWFRSFTFTKVFRYKAIKLMDKINFQNYEVNNQRLKPYLGSGIKLLGNIAELI